MRETLDEIEASILTGRSNSLIQSVSHQKYSLLLEDCAAGVDRLTSIQSALDLAFLDVKVGVCISFYPKRKLAVKV